MNKSFNISNVVFCPIDIVVLFITRAQHFLSWKISNHCLKQYVYSYFNYKHITFSKPCYNKGFWYIVFFWCTCIPPRWRHLTVLILLMFYFFSKNMNAFKYIILFYPKKWNDIYGVCFNKEIKIEEYAMIINHWNRHECTWKFYHFDL